MLNAISVIPSYHCLIERYPAPLPHRKMPKQKPRNTPKRQCARLEQHRRGRPHVPRRASDEPWYSQHRDTGPRDIPVGEAVGYQPYTPRNPFHPPTERPCVTPPPRSPSPRPRGRAVTPDGADARPAEGPAQEESLSAQEQEAMQVVDEADEEELKEEPKQRDVVPRTPKPPPPPPREPGSIWDELTYVEPWEVAEAAARVEAEKRAEVAGTVFRRGTGDG